MGGDTPSMWDGWADRSCHLGSLFVSSVLPEREEHLSERGWQVTFRNDGQPGTRDNPDCALGLTSSGCLSAACMPKRFRGVSAISGASCLWPLQATDRCACTPFSGLSLPESARQRPKAPHLCPRSDGAWNIHRLVRGRNMAPHCVERSRPRREDQSPSPYCLIHRTDSLMASTGLPVRLRPIY